MSAAKVISIAIGVVLLLAGGAFFFIPSLRPGLVDRWFRQAKGLGPATSPEDALDKFKRAIEKRDYDAAQHYLTGEYAGLFVKGKNDAKELATGVDELAYIMKNIGVKSDKVDMWLYWFDPFPTFRYEVKSKGATEATAVIHWTDDAPRVQQTPEQYRIDALLLHSLLCTGTPLPAPLYVTVKQVGKEWRIEMPYQWGDRSVAVCVDALRRKATNYRNAMQKVKNDIKNDPGVKSEFERQFRENLEGAN